MDIVKNNKTKMRILHGLVDVAGQGSYSVRGLRKIGENARMVVWRQNPFGYPVDVDLEKKFLRNGKIIHDGISLFQKTLYIFKLIKISE